MGTLKLNKQVKNAEKETAEVVEESLVQERAKVKAEQVADEAVKENAEVCEFAKGDDGFVEEIKELRTENETVYRRNDRTCRKIITLTPTRYRDENGELKDIKNTLTDNGKEITNGENSFKVKFNKDAHSGKIFDLQKGKNILTLTSVVSDKARGHVCGCSCELCAGKDNTVSATLDDGTEIQYVTLNDRIKENIIVKERQESYEYNFALNIGNLTVEEGENNILLLKDAETGKTEFTIPAPFMYDANNKCSDKVSYEIDLNGEELLIKVVADAEFINAEDRSFPVTIDPQIISTGADCGITYETLYETFDDDETIEHDPYNIEAKWIDSVTYCEAVIKYTVPTSIKEGIITNVKLYLTCTGGYGRVVVNGKIIEPSDDEYIDVYFDVTNLYGGTFKIVPKANSYSEFSTYGQTAPRFVIEYVEGTEAYGDKQYEGEDKPTIKEFDFTDKAKGYLYVNGGEILTSFKSFDSSDFVLPINITHTHKLGLGLTNYGLNWRLNLDRKLTKAKGSTSNTTRYIYTDEFGDKYVFSEKYYYINGTAKHFVSKENVTINVDGEMTHSGHPVYALQLCNGYTLVPEINDFKNSELIEQRQEEQIQLEEYVKQCESSLKNYLKVQDDSGEITTERLGLLTKEKFDALTKLYNYNLEHSDSDTPDYLIMTESEVYQLQSLYAELSKLAKGSTRYNEVEAQKNYILAEAKDISLFEDTYIKYFSKKAELDLLLLNIPVNYIKDKNGIINGFNKEGDLVVIGDSYGNAVSIDYNANRQIAGLSDSNGKTISFEYSDGLLMSITDNCGRTVKYHYSINKLDWVTFADGSSLIFTYQSNKMRTVESSNYLQVKLSYDNYKRITEIKNWSPHLSISNEAVEAGDNFTETISDWTINYTNNITISNNGTSETYRFDQYNRIIFYQSKDNQNNTREINYSYSNSSGRQITAVEQYNDEPATTTVKKFNNMELLTNETNEWQQISDTVRVKVVKEYEYDINNQLISEIISKRTEVDGVVKQPEKQYTNYTYNAKGSPILTESYVEGEELISGKNYKKQVYDNNGNIVKTIEWNSLDSSSKFYSEINYAENGQVIADLDELGNVTSEYEYATGTNVVNSVKNANGSKIAYGRNPYNYEIESITQSTDDGESNTNDILRQCGLPVTVKSGNTVIDYTYNALRQLSQVSVNNNVQMKSEYKGYSYDSEEEYARYIEKTDTYYFDDTQTVKACYKKYGDLDEEFGKMKVSETLTVDKQKLYEKLYSVKGLLESITYKDSVSKTLTYSYNDYDLLTEVVDLQGDDVKMTESYSYDGENKLTSRILTGEVNQSYSYYYKSNFARLLDYIKFGNYKFKPLSDVNGRNTGKEIYSGDNKVAAEYITYRKVGDHASNMPATVWFGSGSQIKDSIKYKYDKCGNICEITESGHIVAKYEYDSLNRLIREDNKALGKTTIFTYDQCGNIIERCEYAYTSKSGEELSGQQCTHYSYDYEGDKLVRYNNKAITYNNLGNPKSYCGKTVTWQYGTRLTQFGGTTFTYDGLGRRTSKNGRTFTYDNDGRLIKQSNGLEFVYDNSGVIGVKYNSAQYFYRKDAQGNIIAILDSSGNIVVNYKYDAWGNHAVLKADGSDATSGIGVLNPFRYRGYYYDTETELYYLQTRYYDPETGRFISQDSIEYAYPEIINGLNLYAYCYNNPNKYIDFMGNIPIANYISRITESLNFKGLYSKLWGRIGYTVSTTKQNKDTGFFYAFKQTGIAFNKSEIGTFKSGGVGINAWSWLGIELGYNEEYNVTIGGNITPWFHFGIEGGLSGINITLGINIDNTSHDITIGIGLGLAVVAVSVVAVVVSAGALLEPVINFFRMLFA